jgi:hypothetical protein
MATDSAQRLHEYTAICALQHASHHRQLQAVVEIFCAAIPLKKRKNRQAGKRASDKPKLRFAEMRTGQTYSDLSP